MAANRIGKTEGVGGYEMTLHLTGQYPPWWEGRRFNHPVMAWAAGDTNMTVRDIIQLKLLGPTGMYGTGLIPQECIIKTMNKAGVPDAVELIQVRHITGGISYLSFKSYEQGRKSFQGTELDVIWLDEEPPEAVYMECLTRTMTTEGLVMCTFTPLLGISDVVKYFLPDGRWTEDHCAYPSQAIIMAGWNDAPHLTEEAKKELMAKYPAYQRDARTKGIPQLGVGAIYPIAEEEITIKPFKIPPYWPRVYGMDVGWNKTAALWLALDKDSDIVYAYSNYYAGQLEPPIHASAINGRGRMPGVIDPTSRNRNSVDGEKLLDIYRNLGLQLVEADNARETGIYEVWTRLSTGRLKIFENLNEWFAEFRVYRRDEKGHVVKENDHLMDATRYVIVSGLSMAAIVRPNERENRYRLSKLWRKRGTWKAA